MQAEVTSSWSLTLFNYQDDARCNKHKINIVERKEKRLARCAALLHSEVGASRLYPNEVNLTHILTRYLLRRTFNVLTPNVNYSGRTAPLTSKVAFYIFIQQV